MLQVFISEDLPEHVPPLLSTSDLDLDLDCFPPPQLLEHFEYVPQTPHLQLLTEN